MTCAATSGIFPQPDSFVQEVLVILDLELPLLDEVVGLLDRQLDRIQEEAHRVADPDAFGMFDRLEHVTGLGFAACQNYIASWAGRSGVSKQAALQIGPSHRTGQPFVSLINAAANYWKHSPEWNGADAAPAQRTSALLASLGVRSSEYALTNCLHELVQHLPARFGTLVPLLAQWRDGLTDRLPRRGSA